MKATLSTRQLMGIICAFVLLAGLLGYRYFTAPVASTYEKPEDRALHGTTIASLSLVFLERTPQHLKAPPPETLHRPLPTPPPPRDEDIMMPGGMPMSEEQRKRASEREARKARLIVNAIAYLRRSGIPLSADEPFHQPSPNEAPLYVTVTMENELGVYDGQPTWGNLTYKVELERMVILSPGASTPMRVSIKPSYPVFPRLADFVGPVSPESLSSKQEEALGRVCEAIVAHWKYDNPASSGKP